ncbi:hypothetical protein V5799_027511 [Amblyomma americanum]|uniref:Transposase n=1 Tax=Amblyomma americanum TaxID=6943 RepID=A0AAQ4DFI2_AMBAM
MGRIVADEAVQEEFVKSLRLAPRSSAVRPPQPSTSSGGRPAKSEYWGICGELGFNDDKPDCVGEVVTYYRVSSKGKRAQFRCNRCRKQLSQLHGTTALRGGAALRASGGASASFFARKDSLRRPNVKLPSSAVLYLTFCMSKEISMTVAREMQNGEVPKQACTDWTNYVREVCSAELSQQPPMGGPGEVVQVDECLMRRKRKANRGRLLAGDNVPAHRQNNYGGVVDRGPWVFDVNKAYCAFLLSVIPEFEKTNTFLQSGAPQVHVLLEVLNSLLREILLQFVQGAHRSLKPLKTLEFGNCVFKALESA